MSHRRHTTERRKQVLLTMFPNEPLARMAAQRLDLEGIPSLVKSLHGGPGLWGSAFNLPHALYVYQSDEALSRDILQIPQEQETGETASVGPTSGIGKFFRWPVVLAVAVGLLLIATSPVWTPLFR